MRCVARALPPFRVEPVTAPRRVAGSPRTVLYRKGPMQTPKYYRLSSRFDFSAISDLPPRQRRVVIAVLITASVLLLSSLVAAGYVWKLVRRLPRAPFQETSRLYARPTPLTAGAAMTAEEMTD